MKVTGKRVKNKEKEYYIIIIMMKYIMVIGKMVKKKEKDYFIILMVKDIKEIGKMI